MAQVGHHQIERKAMKYFRILFQFFMKYSLQDAHLFGIYVYMYLYRDETSTKSLTTIYTMRICIYIDFAKNVTR